MSCNMMNGIRVWIRMWTCVTHAHKISFPKWYYDIVWDLELAKECCNSQNPKEPLARLFAFVRNLTESLHHKAIFFHSYFSPSFSGPQGLRFLPHRNKFVCYGSAFGVCSDALHAFSAHAQWSANCGTSIMSTRRSCDAFKASKKYNLMFKYIIISQEEALWSLWFERSTIFVYGKQFERYKLCFSSRNMYELHSMVFTESETNFSWNKHNIVIILPQIHCIYL